MGLRIHGDFIIDGDCTEEGDLFLGKTTTTGTERNITAQGTEADIDILINPKGDGVIKVPVDYEDNIASEDRALANVAFVKAYDHWKGSWNWATNLNVAPVAERAGDTYWTEDELDSPYIPANSFLYAKIDGASVVSDNPNTSEYLIKP